jgi:hypothetical protein
MPPKSTRTHSLDTYAADRCACYHIVYPDDTPGGDCRWDLCGCENHQSANRPTQAHAAPTRCPGHTCDLGRTQDWIKGEGKIDGQYSDLPPGHFWYKTGSYLAHGEAGAQ